MKCRTLAQLRLNPDSSAVALDNFFAHRQADAGARVRVARVQALEDHEDSIRVLRIDTNAVVAHGK
jgi:hypothetical protein